MHEKAREFCYREFKMCRHTGCDVEQSIIRCYGVIMFVLSIESDKNKNNELSIWWDGQMLPYFRALARDKKKIKNS